MSIKEYANENNLSIAEILKKCKELGIKVTDGESSLSDDDIVVLDNTLLIMLDNEISAKYEDELDEVAESLSEGIILDDDADVISEKIKKKPDYVSKKNDYQQRKKEMYKNKEKLQSNVTNDNDVIIYNDNMSVGELAAAIGVAGSEILKKLIDLGLMLSINNQIDYDNAEIIVAYYNKSLKRAETQDISNFEKFEIVDAKEDLVKRSPVVTIMGHVDHGKTSLLDYIRKSHVVDKEFGGITQHIGAYQIETKGEKITFIDTPGHAAFTEMRARGASITDIVIIIVAADDGVMPQTKEAVDHALAANVPIIVAINKIDKPNVNIDRVLTQMAELNITPESWGGKYPFVNISAQTGEGIDLLLENIIAIGEMLDLKANPSRYALGVVIESSCDVHTGCTATLLIQNGTLRIGDPIVAGSTFGHIRTMKDDLNRDIVEALPGMPVVITGINDNPAAGAKFMAFETEAQGKEVAQIRENAEKNQKYKRQAVNFDDLFSQIQSGVKEIKVVLKTDVRGTEEAVKNALEKINVEGVKIKVIRSGIGAVTESDIVLAHASEAVVIGFNVVPSATTKEYAKSKGVELRIYTIIYKLVEEMELAMKGLLDPEFAETITGHAEVRQLFKFSKVGNIAGSHVTDGVIKASSAVRVIRDSNIIHDGKIASIQRGKDQTREVKNGFDCGITLVNFEDLKEGDIFETYEMVEVKK